MLRSDEQLQMAALMVEMQDPIASRSRRQYRARVFELFAGKFDMDVDVIGSSPRMSDSHFLQDSFRHLSEAILSRQSVDLANWPLRERFRIAMRLKDRTPLDFQCTVGLPMSNRFAQLRDPLMGTALHWAVTEWYNNANFWYSSGVEPTAAYDSCERFVVALLENKALLHALDRRKRTPLTRLLDSTYHMDDDQLWITLHGTYKGCAIAMESWGRLLGNAGVSLPQYIARENDILTARSDGDDIWLARMGGKPIKLTRLVLSEQQSLQLEVTAEIQMDIWEFRPPPGLFPDLREDRLTSFWPPERDDDDQACWQKTSSRDLQSKPFRWTRGHELDPDDHDIFRALFHRAHDDHSALALLLGCDRRRRTHESRRVRRRSSSAPPSAYVHTYLCSYPLHSSMIKIGTEFTLLWLHKCPFDSQWGFDVPGNPGRACMKGCEGRTDYSSMFEEFLEYTASRPKRMASELERIGRIVEKD